MHSVLLVVEKPDTNVHANLLKWQEFQGATANTPNLSVGIRTLGESSWLIDLQKNLPAFVHLAHAAQARVLDYRVLFFPDEPKWIP